MSDEGGRDPRREPLAREGKRFIVGDQISGLLQVVLALAAARTLEWNNAWLYAVVIVAIKTTAALILVSENPAVLNARGAKQTMSKRERIFFSVFVPASLSMPIVAGLDSGRAGWSLVPATELMVGVVVLVAGSSLIVWALAVNPFFEPTVRIQRDRAQTVCASGPYRLVRHPGYTGVMLATVAVPLVLGSRWCFVPAAIIAVAFVVRTLYEDRLLHTELEGYAAYADKTRFRLLPPIW